MNYEGNNEAAESDRIESLRQILEFKLSSPVSYEEALEVGESLIAFYEVLADEAEQEPLVV